MPTRFVAVSDTHVPQRARRLPDEVWRAIEGADAVIHAGDWTGLPILDEFERRAPHLIGVRGNNDGPEFDDRLPLVAREVVEGLRLAVVHETGQASGRERRLDEAFSDADLIVFGHSHIPWDTVTPDGRRILNPGSPTDRRRQPAGTYLSFTLDDGAIADVRFHELPTR